MVAITKSNAASHEWGPLRGGDLIAGHQCASCGLRGFGGPPVQLAELNLSCEETSKLPLLGRPAAGPSYRMEFSPSVSLPILPSTPLPIRHPP